jgi:hypothetical protein
MSEKSKNDGFVEFLIILLLPINFCFDADKAEEKDVAAIESRVQILETHNARLRAVIDDLKQARDDAESK